jgi:hypothetical protein
MKPCSKINSPFTKQNKTRAIRLLGNVLRTSHNPSPSGRHSGIPSGHPYSTAPMSWPSCRQSFTGSSINQSRTGFVPVRWAQRAGE